MLTIVCLLALAQPLPQERVVLWTVDAEGNFVAEIEAQPYTNPTWVILPGSPDFDGDGVTDIVWWQSDPNGVDPLSGLPNSGAVVSWVMNANGTLRHARVVGRWDGVVDGKLAWRPMISGNRILWRFCTAQFPCLH